MQGVFWVNIRGWDMKVNLNDRCSVKLTKVGVERLEKEYWPGYKFNYNPETEVLSIELWHIMNIFGSMLGSGIIELPFVDNMIEINLSFFS